MLDKLYIEYGKIMIQLEILQSKAIEIKKKIVEELNAERNNPSKG